MAHKENHLQLIVDRFADAVRFFGLTISHGKTVVLVQPVPNTMRPQLAITINEVRLKCVDNFKHLVSEISADGSLDSEITSRIQKASQALGRLGDKVLQQKGITLSTWLKIYKAIVFSSLLYGFETWTMYCRHVKQLENFHNRSLLWIMNIRWQDKITNQEVLDRADATSIESLLLNPLWTEFFFSSFFGT